MCEGCRRPPGSTEETREGHRGGPAGMGRRRFLELAGSGAVGAALLAAGAPAAFAQDRQPLGRTFEAAGGKHGVPPELLKAMGYVHTRWAMPPASAVAYERGDIHGQGVYGVMALEQNPSRDTLGKASELTGLSEAQLTADRAANVMGGAAVLSELAGGTKPRTLEGWQEAVAAYGAGDLYAREVYYWLAEGAEATLAGGERVDLAARDVAVPRAVEPRAGNVDYPRATWRGPASDNYSNRNREAKLDIDRVIIHIADGYYEGTINWFKTQSSNVSAHYVVRSRDGEVAQLVRNEDIAWHAGVWSYNQHSIGIEHEGFDENPDWYTNKMYHGSAKLTAWCCKRHRIPVDRKHIIGHTEVPGIDKPCPGRPWRWEKYISLVRDYRARL
jgi:hypothetical protein